MPARIRLSAALAISLAAASVGCMNPPACRFEARDAEGRPLAGVAVKVTSSAGLAFWLPKRDSREEDGGFLASNGPTEFTTDGNGIVELSYSVPDEPGYFPALLGADPVGRQWIRFEWTAPDGRKFASLVWLDPAGPSWTDMHERYFFDGYTGEGVFVEGPADIGNRVGFLLGTPLAHGISLPFAVYPPAHCLAFAAPLSAATRLSGLAAGAPFYLLKKAFWDGPRAILGAGKQ